MCCERVAQVWVWTGPELRVFRQVCTLNGHAGYVNSVACFPDGKRVVSGSQDKLVKIWDAKPQAEVRSFLWVH